MVFPQKAAVVGSGELPTTAGVTKRMTSPIPGMTVIIEKNSARPPFQKAVQKVLGFFISV
jgi:hypothetical protein